MMSGLRRDIHCHLLIVCYAVINPGPVWSSGQRSELCFHSVPAAVETAVSVQTFLFRRRRTIRGSSQSEPDVTAIVQPFNNSAEQSIRLTVWFGDAGFSCYIFILIPWKLLILFIFVKERKELRTTNRLKKQENNPNAISSLLSLRPFYLSFLLSSPFSCSSLLFSSLLSLALLSRFSSLLLLFSSLSLLFFASPCISKFSCSFVLLHTLIFSLLASHHSHLLTQSHLTSLFSTFISLRLYCVCWIIRAIFKFYSFSYLFILPRCFHQQSY